MKWWLVSEDTLTEIRFILGLAIKDPGQGESYKSAFRDALHTLETGMHHTDAVPADFADSEPEVIRDKANDDAGKTRRAETQGYLKGYFDRKKFS